MFYSDYHVHTHFSGDSKTLPEDTIKKAIDLGVKKLCITDHYDADYPTEDIIFTFDISDYFHTLESLQDKYKKDIHILIGIELGLQPHLKDYYDKIINNHPFDFIIGSSHLVDGIDPYLRAYYKNKSEHTAYGRYLESIIENIDAFSGFQVYGHLDYIVRYGPYDNKLISHSNYTDIIDALLLKLIHNHKGIEINTSGIRYGLGNPHPNVEIIKRYKELGGEIITIGSDAHIPDHLCSKFNEVYDILKSHGYKYYTVFEKQKPEFIKL
ncbi:histidinol-phosphatase (PHP family) [Natranaerovirga pectinivora]|uniref:Histidinol-phosphatase n=1 Tax=Natranaerovirga pectinivora TaxID=682400 RepID=A0A4R3MQL9_9FIRM|nr:histidinol-phosphatase HisJ family protein [Natranaerovirga pectinivora]TCT16186.1 histidinol-phosphatase (PHP family) [Natranaerovirga pectinivora]